MGRFVAAGSLILLLLIASCRIAGPGLYPPPEKIDGIEGYASLRLSAGEETTRSRFSFSFHFPSYGRIEVTDFFGKSLFQLFFVDEEAFVVVPAKKLYWKGEEVAVVDFYLGFELTASDLFTLISGSWGEDRQHSVGPDGPWMLYKDREGRVDRVESGALRLEIDDFFGRSSVARTFSFAHPGLTGRIRILSVGFNPPQKEGRFELDFLQELERVTWETLQKAFDHGN